MWIRCYASIEIRPCEPFNSFLSRLNCMRINFSVEMFSKHVISKKSLIEDSSPNSEDSTGKGS